MRKQYHSRKIGADLYVWDVHQLVRKSKNLRAFHLPLSEITELDENWWYDDGKSLPTPRAIAAHIALVAQTDLKHPIILCQNGRLMDGMHRAVKALTQQRSTILAIRFPHTPEPDYINVNLENLPYPDEDV
ncbi:hypothetical protein [Flexibacterium corallicola]|uniref:hypothetical protein n=1 Tax=Flexibacterium corallicola TaxID=3037259 RepID=UPI00286FA91A|nr:hypothetical protein [Pseudovibrio sp. M1P-2-3]